MKDFFVAHKKTILILLSMVMVASAVLTYFYFPPLDHHQTAGSMPSTPTATNPTQVKLAELKSLNVLLLGYGGAGHQGGFLTDAIQLVHVNFEQSAITMISIPRDLWIKLPNGKEAKVNAAFTLGDDPNKPVASGGQVAKKMMSAITGLPIDYFIAIDFVGFQRAIGQELGGIEVKVPEALDDPWYPIRGEELNPCGLSADEIAQLSVEYSGFELEKQFECRYEHLRYDPGLTHMEGGEALKYVRSRHGSPGGDFSRSQRQQAVLVAIRDKLLSLEALDNLPEFFEQLVQHTTSDIDLEIAQYLAPALKSVGQFETTSLILSTENVFTSGQSATGQSILVPKDSWQAVQTYVQNQLNR